MSDGSALLAQLDANKQSLLAKQAELKGFLEEKTANINALDTLMKVTVPQAQSAVSAASQAVQTAYSNYTTNVDAAKKRTQAAYTNKQNAYAAYQTISERHTLWQGRYQNGCKWTGADSGWQGFYCGDFKAFCRNTSHDPEQNAPSGCLKSDVRKYRQGYALSSYQKAATDKNTSYSAYTSANAAYDKAVKDQTAVENNKSGIASAESAKQKAVDILNGLINPINGKQVTLQKRIGYIDQQINAVNATISELEREKSAMEVRYQEFLADEVAKQKLIEERAKQAQAERDQVKTMTEASIQANLAPKDPLAVKAQENKMLYILGIAAVGLGALYILKK